MKLPTINVTTFWKWFWLACAAVALKGPQLVELASSLQLPHAVHVASFIVGLAGLLLTLQIHPDGAPSKRTTLAPPLAMMVLGLLCGLSVACSATPAQVINDETLALDLTNAACSAADATGNPIVLVSCSVAQIAENGEIAISKVLLNVSSSQVGAFIANAPGARKVTKSMLVPFKAPTASQVAGACR